MKITVKNSDQKNKIVIIKYDEKKWATILKETKKEEEKKIEDFKRNNKNKSSIDFNNIKVDEDVLLRLASNKAVRTITTNIKEYKELTAPKDTDSVIEITKSTKKELEITFSYFQKPKVEINKIDDIKVSIPPRPRINETELNRYITSFIKMRSPRTDSKNPVKSGDLVNIDFKGKIDNKPFEGGEAANYNLEIGSKTFIPGFEDQIIGMKLNDSKDINIKFPDNYPVDKFKNKNATFSVKVNRITQFEVPPLTNDLVKSFNIRNINDVGSFKNYCKNTMMNTIVARYNQNISNIVVDNLIKTINLEIPGPLRKLEIRITKTMFQDQAKQSNMTLKEFAKKNGLNPDDYENQLELIAVNKIKLSYILRQYMIESKLQVSDSEFKTAYDQYLNQNPNNQKITLNEFKSRYINDRALSEIVKKVLENSGQIN